MAANQGRDVPQLDPGGFLFGQGLLGVGGTRGVVAGRPYGEQLEAEKQEMLLQYRFRPAAAAALSAATRKALGR